MKELFDLETLLSKLEREDDLTEWEADFVDDMSSRVMKYEHRTFISGNQWEQLERMERKYFG